MNYNCLGVPVPDDVTERAKEHGCVGGVLYVYKDGQYGGSPPRASIGCTQASSFRRKWWEKFKVELCPGWVAFRSPSGTARQLGSKPSRVTGKGSCKPCLICDEDRFTEEAHFPTPDRHGGVETVSLCPTHHRLLDNGRLSDWEIMEIYRKKFLHLGLASAKEFANWAHSNKYPYSFEHMLRKSVRTKYNGVRQISYRIENDDGLAGHV